MSVQASSPAAARVRRALRATASSIIWPSIAPTPLAFSARIARALVHRLGARRQRRVDRADLRGVNGGLGGEAERHRGSDLLLQAGLVVQIEEWGVDRRHARQSTGRDEAAAREGRAVPKRSVAPRSAAISAAPSIRPASRGVAVAIASTAASPRALSIRPMSRCRFARRGQ